MIPIVLPTSVVIATRNRSEVFRRTLESLAGQAAHPAELIVIDGSDDDLTELVCRELPAGLQPTVVYQKADRLGAAVQRNQGIRAATHDVIWFHDDDILFETDCVPRLWAALHSDPTIGGVNAMIVNQKYAPPGQLTRAVLRLIGGRGGQYAGRVVGPGVNMLPADQPDLPEIVPVEWLNTTCTMYHRAVMPDPPFPGHFTGYSLMEDLTLSLTVGRGWKLANARTARIFHDSQSGDHKRSHATLSEMELINRHYVMTQVLGKRRLDDYLRLGMWELFLVVASATTGVGRLVSEVWGKLRAIAELLTRGSS